MKLTLLTILLFLIIIFIHYTPVQAAQDDLCTVTEPVAPPIKDAGLSLAPETVKLLWEETAGQIISYMQDQLKEFVPGKVGTLVRFHLAGPGILLDIGLTLKEIDEGKYQAEVGILGKPGFLATTTIAGLATGTVAAATIAWAIPIIVAAAPTALTTVTAVVGTVVLVAVFTKVSEIASAGLVYAVAKTKQLTQIGAEAAREFIGTTETWVYDAFSDDKIRIHNTDGQQTIVESWIGGQCTPLLTSLPVEQIARAVGMSEPDFRQANAHLAYQNEPDGAYLDYRANENLKATLPGGNSMDVAELILRIQLGLPILADTTNTDLDLMFVIDTTGSMEDDIAEVKQRALEIINQVSANSSSWRIGIVTYRDYPQDPYGDPGDYVSRLDLPFSSDQNTIIAGINSITIAGGGDPPEAVFAALLDAISQPWRPGVRKVIILMGDAPPHDPDPIEGTTGQDVLQAAYNVDPANIFPILIESANAVRFPFQVLADGSSGRLFYAANADEVVPTLLSTIGAATSVQLSVGLDVQVDSLDPAFALRTTPSMNAAINQNTARSERATIIDGPQLSFEMSADHIPQNFVWWKIRTDDGNEGWMQETYYGEPILVPYSSANPVLAVECTLSTLGDVNIRSGPGTDYQQIASRKGKGKILAANGQFGNISNPSTHWWQLTTGFWVRDDQVHESGNCAGLPAVEVSS